MHCHAGNVVSPLSSLLLKLFVLRQPMLSRSATDCLEMLCGARNSRLGATALADLLQQVLHQEAAWDKKDADLMLALTKLVETGFIRYCLTHLAVRMNATYHAHISASVRKLWAGCVITGLQHTCIWFASHERAAFQEAAWQR